MIWLLQNVTFFDNNYLMMSCSLFWIYKRETTDYLHCYWWILSNYVYFYFYEWFVYENNIFMHSKWILYRNGKRIRFLFLIHLWSMMNSFYPILYLIIFNIINIVEQFLIIISHEFKYLLIHQLMHYKT